jgi:hypothetical protein
MLHNNPNHLGIPQDPQKFLSFSVQPRADFGDHPDLCPPLFSGKGLKALNLPFQILFLVSGGHSGVEHRGAFWARRFYQDCPSRQLASRDRELPRPKPPPGSDIADPLLTSPIRELHG